ncbi:ABC transporter permease [Herbiconiux sp. YIM B11900]|uniref:ABC transporter permease n=1 Tax=Herbiconiux sp. YIM B11900 TaxID=3404131 RepID=UPI003F83CED7
MSSAVLSPSSSSPEASVPTPAPDRARPRAGRGFARRVLRPISSLWILALLLVAWEVVGRVAPSVFFPPFSVVMTQFAEDWWSGDPATLFLSEQFWASVPISLSRLARGWGLAVVFGLVIGFALGRSPIARMMYSPVIRFWMSVPNAALLPIALQFFGVTEGMNIFLICFGTVWLITVNTADGVAGVNPDWVRSARSLHLPRWTLYRRVILPAASPHIFAGLRISVSFALILMIVAELYATTAGLGHDVALYQQTFRYKQMWSAFVLIALLGIAINVLFDLLERRVLRWQRRTGLADL